MKDNPSVFKYRSLINELESGIKSGNFRPGDRLPSIRKLHRELSLSVSTIYQAYDELEKMNLVEARPRSGYYVKPVSDGISNDRPGKQPRAVPVTLSSMVAGVLKDNRDDKMVHLGTSTPSPDLLPGRSLRRIMRDISEKEMKRLMDYSLAEGDPELRRAICRITMGTAGNSGPGDIIVTQGCMEAITLALMSVTRPGDAVLLDSPTHLGFLQLLQKLGLMALEIPADPGTGTDVEALERILACRKIGACLLVPNFHNPTGALVSDEKKRSIVQLTNARDIPVIEDNVFSELYFGSRKPLSLKKYDKKNLVISCSSFSKTISPGIRVGWIAPGPRFYHKILSLRTGVSISASSLDQHIIMRFLKNGGYDRYIRELKNELKTRMGEIINGLQVYFPSNIKFTKPQGGTLLWVELDSSVDSLSLFHEARENKIALAPGVFFSVSRNFNHFIRIGCGFPYSAETDQGLAALGKLVRGQHDRH